LLALPGISIGLLAVSSRSVMRGESKTGIGAAGKEANEANHCPFRARRLGLKHDLSIRVEKLVRAAVQAVNPQSAESPLPLGATFTEAVQLVWGNRRRFGLFMVAPVVAGFLLHLAYGAADDVSDSTPYSLILIGTYSILDFFVLTWFAVACHRVILIGEEAVPAFGLTRWTWRETRFFLWMFLVYIIGSLLLVLCASVLFAGAVFIAAVCGFSTNSMPALMEQPAFGGIVIVLSSIPFAYVVGRASLVLPATAIDLRQSFSAAWAQSAWNGWRVAALAGGIPVAFLAIQTFMWMIPSRLFEESAHEARLAFDPMALGQTFLQQVVRYTFAVVEIAILSISFRRLRVLETQRPASPAVTTSA